MATALLVSIQVGTPRWHGAAGARDPLDRPWSSAFFKEPVAGPVRVGSDNLDGDGQADRANHGGADKAVLAYSADHYARWRTELVLPAMPFGAFGENLTISGQTEADVCIGDRWGIGPVVLAVTQPRQPCWKLARRWKNKRLPMRVIKTGRGGWYLRVVEQGVIASGMPVELIERRNPAWTIERATRVMYFHKADAALSRELASVPGLSASWRRVMRQRAGLDAAELGAS